MQRNAPLQLASCWILAVVLVVIALSTQQAFCSHITPIEPYYHSAPYHHDPYSYGYDVEDNYGNKQWRQERSTNPHEVHGSYGYRDKNGIYREVTYVADKNGFRANIRTNEPGVNGAKDPASTHIESTYLPPPPPPAAAAPVSSPAAPIYAATVASQLHQQQQQHSPPTYVSPPVYGRAHASPGYQYLDY